MSNQSDNFDKAVELLQEPLNEDNNATDGLLVLQIEPKEDGKIRSAIQGSPIGIVGGLVSLYESEGEKIRYILQYTLYVISKKGEKDKKQ